MNHPPRMWSPLAAALAVAALVWACGGRAPAPGVSVEVPGDVETVIQQLDLMCGQKQYEVAFTYVERALTTLGDDPALLRRYNDLAFYLERYEEALEAARRLDRADAGRSPWTQLKAAEALLKLGRPDEAVACIEVAVNERGFQRYEVFAGELYDPLRGDERFQRCVEAARGNVELGGYGLELALGTVLRCIR